MTNTEYHLYYSLPGTGAMQQQSLESNNPNQISAESGAEYWVRDASGALPNNLIATRTGDQLDIYLDNGAHLIIENYYDVCAGDQCQLHFQDMGGFDASAEQVQSGESLIAYTLGDINLVLIARANNPNILALMKAIASKNTESSDDDGSNWGWLNSENDSTASSENDESSDDDGFNWGWKSLLGVGLGIGALGLAAGSGGGGDDGENEAPVFTLGTEVDAESVSKI